MKKQRSMCEDLDVPNEKGVLKEWGRRDEVTNMRSLKVLDSDSDRSSHRRGFAKVETSWKGYSYDRSIDEDRDSSRVSRKKLGHDSEGFERSGNGYGSRRKEHGESRDSRKGFEIGRQSRDRDSSGGGGFRDNVDSPRKVYSGGGDRIHRADSFSVSRREFYEPPKIITKRFRSERDRSKREGNLKFRVGGAGDWSYGSEEPRVSAWRRATSKEMDEDSNSQSKSSGSGRGIRVGSEDRGNGVLGSSSVISPQGSRDVGKSPPWSKDLVQGLKDVGKSPPWSKDFGQGLRDVGKSPPWSRDSGEQSKSVELRKVEEGTRQSSSSEMEEGELEPEKGEVECSQEMNSGSGCEVRQGVGTEERVRIESEVGKENEEASSLQGKVELHEETEVKQEAGSIWRKKDEAIDDVVQVVKESGEFSDHRDEAIEKLKKIRVVAENTEIPENADLLEEESPSSLNHEECSEMELEPKTADNITPTDGADIGSNPPNIMQESSGVLQESVEHVGCQELPLEQEKKLEKHLDLEKEAEGIDTSDSIKEQKEENNKPELTLKFTKGRSNSELGSSPPNVVEADVNNSGSMSEKHLHKVSDEVAKDKGKFLVLSATNDAGTIGDSCLMERDLLGDRDRHISHVGVDNGLGAMEGLSSRGFELFSGTVFDARSVKADLAVGKHKDKNLKVEPLELSLGLPHVPFRHASHNQNPAPSSPSHARSEHSVPTTFHTRTSSNGFSASASFSGSQSFAHNPSCSLTQNSFENYENSVGSHPLFQGDCQGQSSIEHIPSGSGIMDRFKQRKEVPLYQRILQNGNGVLHRSQASQGILVSNNPAHALTFHECSGFERVMGNASFQGKYSPGQGQHVRGSERCNGIANGLDRQLSLPRDFTEQRKIEYRPSPTHSVESRETRSEHGRLDHKHKKRPARERNSSVLFGSNQRESEKRVALTIGVPDRILAEIASEPITLMSRRLQEMPEQSIIYLKENVREMLQNSEMHEQLCYLQELLKRRSDLTLETLSKSHRPQLEILLSLRTGLQSFLGRNNNVPSSDLVEIFLNLKCRNLACRNSLPVDECDCKICVQKNGFCSSCMCLVCSKFDLAYNTCSWVGCDVCLHWCHTDCGLQELHIRNGYSARGVQGVTEMQFHCIACNHPSEMFGFVKEVFKSCAKDWEATNLSKELEYVKRIFRDSNDVRGKQLHAIAEQMLAKLESRSNLSEVYNHVMSFLTESDSKYGKAASSSPLEELFHKNPEGSNGVVTPTQQSTYRLPSVSTEMVPRLANGNGVLRLDREQVGRQMEDQTLPFSTEKKPVVDELECIVRVKQAEAKMFQARADDARREAEGLNRIAIAKSEKIEEEYANKITKLRLAEAEERRRQKFEELKVLERAHLEYFNMKRRMEADIKDLFLKMEATKRNLSTSPLQKLFRKLVGGVWWLFHSVAFVLRMKRRSSIFFFNALLRKRFGVKMFSYAGIWYDLDGSLLQILCRWTQEIINPMDKWNLMFVSNIWNIWKERNRRTFENRSGDADVVLTNARDVLHYGQLRKINSGELE